jgi:hypothetical protein
LYGGSALIMGVGVGNPEDELDPEDVGVDDLQFVHVVSRWELTPDTLDPSVPMMVRHLSP